MEHMDYGPQISLRVVYVVLACFDVLYADNLATRLLIIYTMIQVEETNTWHQGKQTMVLSL